MTLPLTLAVAAGGVVGAPVRFLLDRWMTTRSGARLPWGTFLVNVTGALILGFLQGLLIHHHLAPGVKAFAATGFCGAYTTFSTYTFETLSLVENGRLRAAGLYAGASLALGLAVAGAGLAIGLAA